MSFRSFVLHAIVFGTRVLAVPGLQQRDGVSFDCKIPDAPGKLPVFTLGDVARFPETLFQNTLRLVADGDIKEQEEDGGLYYYNGDRLLGYYQINTGESHVFPNLAALTPGNFQLDPDILGRFAANDSIIPSDDTGHSIIPGLILSGSQHQKGRAPTTAATYLIEGAIRRTIPFERGLFPVHGSGSRASFSFASDGNLVSLLHRWRSASRGDYVASLPRDGVQRLITSQLEAANLASAVVTGVELGYYDSSNKFIQPVYQFNASIPTSEGLAPRFITGYVPFSGEEQEPLPSIVPSKDDPSPGPRDDEHGHPDCDNSTLSRRQARSVTIGRYVMPNDPLTEGLVWETNKWWDGLAAGGGGRVINSQYYWDDPTTYQSPTANLWINAVNVGFSDGHGNVHYFVTDGNWPDKGPISIPGSLPAAGFGPASGGRLAYWILAQCSVISSPNDYAAADSRQAFDAWWQVFDGSMHAAMGFRDLAQVDGESMEATGSLMGKGAPAAMTWLEGMKRAGKTAVIFPCGRGGDSLYQIENLGRPGCLHMFWYN